jgi:hypothetical protein
MLRGTQGGQTAGQGRKRQEEEPQGLQLAVEQGAGDLRQDPAQPRAGEEDPAATEPACHRLRGGTLFRRRHDGKTARRTGSRKTCCR